MIIIDKTDATFAPVVYPHPRKDGGKIVALVKRRYTIESDGTLTAYPKDQQPAVDADLLYEDDLGRSVRFPSDMPEYKPMVDVVVNGHACPPRGNRVQRITPAVEIVGRRKELAVFGDRYWELARDDTWYITEPEPFTQMPLRWENAYGSIYDMRNPMGKGGDADPRSDPNDPEYPLPNIEDPNNLIRHPEDSPAPVNFGAIPEYWQSRANKFGTRDMFWATFRAPEPPRDHDERYYNAAPDDQQFEHLTGDETILLENMDPDEPFKRLFLPGMRPRLFYVLREDAARELCEIPLGFDTVVVDLNDREVTLVWRGCLYHGYNWVNEAFAFAYLNEERVDRPPVSRERYQELFEEELPQYEHIFEALDISSEKMQGKVYAPVVEQIVATLQEVGASEELIAEFQKGEDAETMLEKAKTKSDELAKEIQDMIDELSKGS